jgi:hypothetical protein
VAGPGPLADVGAGLDVPLVTGGFVRYANLDYAASAPALRAVADRVTELLPLYSSLHRGSSRTGASTSPRPASTTSRSPGTRCTRRSAPGR